MHNIREMIRWGFLPAFALVALLCSERVIQAKVLKWLLLSLWFAFSGLSDCALFLARCNSITTNNYFKCMWIAPFSLMCCVFFVMFRACFHTCNGWPNELNITSVAFFFSFKCSVMGIVWSSMNYGHLFPRLKFCFRFAFVLHVITTLNLELVNL